MKAMDEVDVMERNGQEFFEPAKQPYAVGEKMK